MDATFEGMLTESRAVRSFSQLSLMYGVSAVIATLSALIMGFNPLSRDVWFDPFSVIPLALWLASILLFGVSILISTHVFMAFLDIIWQGIAAGLLHGGRPRARLWAITLFLLLVGVGTFGSGIVLTVLAVTRPVDYADMLPGGVTLLAMSGLFMMIAVVLPALVLGPAPSRGMASLAVGLGMAGVGLETLFAFFPVEGFDRLLGWMGGAFPLTNWNPVFGAMVAASAFLTWGSYQFVRPGAEVASAPA